MFLGPRGCLHPGMWCSAGWSTTGRIRLGRSIGPSSTGMTWELVGVGMRSISWTRPGFLRRHLGICLLGDVFLVVFVRHLFLGDLVLVCFFGFLFVVCLLSWVWGSPFFFCCYICCVITVGFWSGFLVVLWLFFLLFLVLGKLGFLVSFVVISGLLFCIYLF